MPFGFALHVPRTLLVVMASYGLVHWPLPSMETYAQARAKVPAARAAKAPMGQGLPQPVADIRAAILAAVASGNIEEMRTALDWNELKPDVAEAPVADAIAHWRAISADGTGADILAMIGEILNQPHAVLPVGRDVENSRLYVWPRFAEAAEPDLSPAERDAMARLIPAEVRAQMLRAGRYLWWRLVIGADGTWHAFVMAK